MGHFAHLRNIPSYKQVWAKQWLNNRVSWKLLSALYPKDAVCLVESGPVVIERGILKSYHCVSLCYLSFIFRWKECGPSFEQIWIPFSQKCFVPSLVEIAWPSGSKKRSMYFRYYLPLRKVWTNLNPIHLKMLCAKFEICPLVLKKKMKM